jgi:hypothetical protein
MVRCCTAGVVISEVVRSVLALATKGHQGIELSCNRRIAVLLVTYSRSLCVCCMSAECGHQGVASCMCVCVLALGMCWRSPPRGIVLVCLHALLERVCVLLILGESRASVCVCERAISGSTQALHRQLCSVYQLHFWWLMNTRGVQQQNCRCVPVGRKLVHDRCCISCVCGGCRTHVVVQHVRLEPADRC